MPTFNPPTDAYLNLTDFDVDTPPTPNMRLSFRLLLHAASLPRGRNVYKTATNTYTENQPADITTVLITYQGGHTHTVSVAEAAELTVGGYGAYLS